MLLDNFYIEITGGYIIAIISSTILVTIIFIVGFMLMLLIWRCSKYIDSFGNNEENNIEDEEENNIEDDEESNIEDNRYKFDHIIFSFGSKKGVGKSTLTNYLKNFYGGAEVNFADPLKQISMILFGLTEEEVTDPKLKETFIPRLNTTPRNILQKLGTEIGRNIIPEIFPEIPLTSNNIWIDIFKRTCDSHFENGTKIIWNSDMRFEDEYNFILSKNGVYIDIQRESNISNNQISTDQHSSEQQNISDYAHGRIINDSDIDTLKIRGLNMIERFISILETNLTLKSRLDKLETLNEKLKEILKYNEENKQDEENNNQSEHKGITDSDVENIKVNLKNVGEVVEKLSALGEISEGVFILKNIF